MQWRAIKRMLRNVIYKGSDVRMADCSLSNLASWPRRTIRPERWHWKVILSYGMHGQHINLLEMQAVLAAIRWRCRNASNIKSRFIHLCDSQVCISVLAKGRSSSRVMNHLLKKVNALTLATGMQMSLSYVRTDLNPADRPSRWAGKRKK